MRIKYGELIGFETQNSKYFFVSEGNSDRKTLYSHEKLEMHSPISNTYTVHDLRVMQVLMQIQSRITEEQIDGLLNLEILKPIDLQKAPECNEAVGFRVFMEFENGAQILLSDYKAPIYGPVVD